MVHRHAGHPDLTLRKLFSEDRLPWGWKYGKKMLFLGSRSRKPRANNWVRYGRSSRGTSPCCSGGVGTPKETRRRTNASAKWTWVTHLVLFMPERFFNSSHTQHSGPQPRRSSHQREVFPLVVLGDVCFLQRRRKLCVQVTMATSAMVTDTSTSTMRAQIVDLV
ncbi:hypothetical protein GN956_G7739 [Arapaima gigas]